MAIPRRATGGIDRPPQSRAEICGCGKAARSCSMERRICRWSEASEGSAGMRICKPFDGYRKSGYQKDCQNNKKQLFRRKAAFQVAAEEGFEPSQTESESVVLPLHNSAICGAAVPCDFNSIQREWRRVKSFFQKNKKRCKTFANAVKLNAAKRLRPLFCRAQRGAQLFQRTLFDARYISTRLL